MRPAQLGVHSAELPLAELVEYIDWTPFFSAWELHGRYPRILDDAVVGAEARKLYHDAQTLLEQMVAQRWVTAKAVWGLFPANAQGDDILLYQDQQRQQVLMTLHHLRQQSPRPEGKPQRCLSDFVAPVGMAEDYLGAFAVTAGLGLEAQVALAESAHDDYRAILLKALADRLAEAAAEYLHQQVRCQYWGYASREQLDNQALIEEQYQGIRPAPGYPACPDHTEKASLWQLLEVEARTGMQLTESFAMHPAASVSGWYFAHPQARYFGVGAIGQDQVADYAQRKGWTLEQAQRWLAPLLG